MPPRPWKFLKSKTNREILSWLGGGATVVAAGIWAVVVFFHQGKGGGEAPAPQVTQSGTGIASGRDTVIHGPVAVGLDEKKNAEQITQAQKPLDDKLEKLLALTAREKGVEIPPLRAILVKLGEAGVGDEDIAKRLDEKANELVKLREEIARLRQGPAELGSFAQQAQALIDKGDFDSARATIAAAREANRKLRERSSLYDGELLALEANVDHLQLAYRKAATKLAEAAGVVAAIDRTKQWGYVLSQAAELLALGNEFGDNAALAESVAVHRQALALAPRSERPFDWADSQNNLAGALSSLGQREDRTSYFDEAILASREAMKEFTREREPVRWAMAQNNVGANLMRLGERETGTARLEQAVTAFREAVEEVSRGGTRQDWAMLQTNLAGALTTLGRRENSTTRLEEGVTAFRAALSEVSRERDSTQWAVAETNLASALASLGCLETGTTHLVEAVATFGDALKELPRKRVPYLWAHAQSNLGSALQALGERETGAARLEQAVDAFHGALEVLSREGAPAQWATTQNNLGNAFMTLGQREVSVNLGQREISPARFKEAAAAFRETLKVKTRQRDPSGWAQVEYNLGLVLQSLGPLEDSDERFEESIAAFGEALKERTREHAPLDWAATTASQGGSLVFLAVRRSDPDKARAAVAQIEAASATMRDQGQASTADAIEAQLVNVRALIAQLKAP